MRAIGNCCNLFRIVEYKNVDRVAHSCSSSTGERKSSGVASLNTESTGTSQWCNKRVIRTLQQKRRMEGWFSREKGRKYSFVAFWRKASILLASYRVRGTTTQRTIHGCVKNLCRNQSVTQTRLMQRMDRGGCSPKVSGAISMHTMGYRIHGIWRWERHALLKFLFTQIRVNLR